MSGGIKPRPAIVRAWARIQRGAPDECWVWPGATNGAPGFYPIIGSGGGKSPFYVHRLVYEHEVGEIPPGWQIDHLCRNTRCVNPSHLEAVTQRENLMRGRTLPAVNKAKTHCKRGHEFTEENTRRNSKGHRCCKTCVSDRDRNRQR